MSGSQTAREPHTVAGAFLGALFSHQPRRRTLGADPRRTIQGTPDEAGRKCPPSQRGAGQRAERRRKADQIDHKALQKSEGLGDDTRAQQAPESPPGATAIQNPGSLDTPPTLRSTTETARNRGNY